MSDPWCVKWAERKEPDGSKRVLGWCATFRNSKPGRDATKDKTACGQYVMFRIGSARQQPTCADCLRIVAKRKRSQAEGT